jgi:serine/threonine protein kinase
VYDVGRKVQRFEIVAHLGTGGMGTVVRAYDPRLERDVALKLLAHGRPSMPGLLQNETSDLRSGAPAQPDDLMREARMMARLSHPNLLPVYEVGLDTDTVFVVMEHIDGADLRAWSRAKSKREIEAALVQAARGLAAAHAQKIAGLEIMLAEIEAGTGHLAEAKQRAKRVRDALLPMSNISRRHADAVLAR